MQIVSQQFLILSDTFLLPKWICLKDVFITLLRVNDDSANAYWSSCVINFSAGNPSWKPPCYTTLLEQAIFFSLVSFHQFELYFETFQKVEDQGVYLQSEDVNIFRGVHVSHYATS